MIRTHQTGRMSMRILLLSCLLCAFPAAAQLRAGMARASITPLEANIETQLGGYGAREGKPAQGIHDTLYAKALVLEGVGKKAALVTLDVCSVPMSLVEESVAKAQIDGLAVETVLMSASHSHAGLEGASMDRRNVANNPYIGIFKEEILNFVSDRVAQALREANAALQPVRAGSGSIIVSGMNRNRRGDRFLDEGLTVLRLDKADGKPYVVLVNFTAHGTIMSENEMLTSGGWAGNMQRTVEALLGEGVTCMYTNGAVGDISPAGARGGSRWERAEDYGRRVGIAAARLAEQVKTKKPKVVDIRSVWVNLPPQQGAPDFVKIAGDEYHVTQEQLDAILPVMFPNKAPLYALRINDFEMVTFPGEPICQLGLAVKQALKNAGIKHPCVASLTSDSIGYILTKEEYHESGYEVTASFYGDGLGQLMLDNALALGLAAAESD